MFYGIAKRTRRINANENCKVSPLFAFYH